MTTSDITLACTAIPMVIIILVLVNSHLVLQAQVGELRKSISSMSRHIRFLTDYDSDRLMSDMRRDMQAMHELILEQRALGNLDAANQLMEYQHAAMAGYEGKWLEGLYRGFVL